MERLSNLPYERVLQTQQSDVHETPASLPMPALFSPVCSADVKIKSKHESGATDGQDDSSLRATVLWLKLAAVVSVAALLISLLCLGVILAHWLIQPESVSLSTSKSSCGPSGSSEQAKLAQKTAEEKPSTDKVPDKVNLYKTIHFVAKVLIHITAIVA